LGEPARALLISPAPTHPPDQGNRSRILQLGRALKQRGLQVHFLWYAWERGGATSQADMQAMAQEWHLFHAVPIKPAGDAYRKPSGQFGIDDLWDDKIEDSIHWLHNNFSYDLVVANYVFMSRALQHLQNSGAALVLDTHDLMSGRDDLLAGHGLERQFFYTSRSEEARAYDRSDLVLAIKPEDQSIMQRMTDRPVLVVGHDLPEAFEVWAPEAVPFRAGMIGSNNGINRACFASMIEALSQHRHRLPEAFRLLIAGQVGAALPQPLPDFVELMGVQASLPQFYGAVDLCLVPVAFGTGLKIKTVEALSYGCPVAGLSHAFEGLEATEPSHTAAGYEDLAIIVADLLSDATALQRLAETSRAVFRRYRRTVSGQYEALLAACADVASAKVSTLSELASPDDMPEDMPIIVYGAGAGCGYFLSILSTQQQSRVVAILDAYKAGDQAFGYPLFRPDALPVGQRSQALVVLTITTPEIVVVRDRLTALGYRTIRSGRRLILNGLFGPRDRPARPTEARDAMKDSL